MARREQRHRVNMIRRHLFLLLLLFMFLSMSFAAAQPGGDGKKAKKGKGGEDEDAKMAKLIEKSFKKNETERDKFIKEIVKLAPDQPLADDFGAWFDRVATAPGVWDRDQIDRKQIAEIFDRVAARMELQGTKITRGDFIRYGQTYLREGRSPPWKDAKGMDLDKEVEKMFRHFDRDGDGFLTPGEMPAALRADMRRWDRNGDGRIDFEEYRAYFPNRLERVFGELQNRLNDGAPSAGIREEDLDRKPTVIAPGKLPTGLPAWFAQLDTDKDGQVAMYEWRRAGWPIEEFEKLDLNSDGFLVPQEILILLAVTERDGTRPYAYLMDMGGTRTSLPDKLAKKQKKGK
jgi:EF hand